MGNKKNFPGTETIALEKYKGKGKVILMVSCRKKRKLYIARTVKPHKYAKDICRWLTDKNVMAPNAERLRNIAGESKPEDWAFEVFTEHMLESQIRERMEGYTFINDAPMIVNTSKEETATAILLEHKETGFKYLFSNKNGIEGMSKAQPPRTVFEKIFQIHHGITNRELIGPFSPKRSAIREIFEDLSEFDLCFDRFNFSVDKELSAMTASARSLIIRRKNVELLNKWANGIAV